MFEFTAFFESTAKSVNKSVNKSVKKSVKNVNVKSFTVKNVFITCATVSWFVSVSRIHQTISSFFE